MVIYELPDVEPKAKIAIKPIIVYKFLQKDDRSPIYGFCYNPNSLYSRIGLGIRLEKAKNIDVYRIDEGFHAFTTKEEALKSDYNRADNKLVLMHIPIGAVYYITHRMTVSDKIRSLSLEDISNVLND